MVSWAESDRGVSYIFGKKVVENFMERHEMDLVVRAHQVVQKGYEFFARRKMVTVFSAPNYMGEVSSCFRSRVEPAGGPTDLLLVLFFLV